MNRNLTSTSRNSHSDSRAWYALLAGALWAPPGSGGCGTEGASAHDQQAPVEETVVDFCGFLTELEASTVRPYAPQRAILRSADGSVEPRELIVDDVRYFRVLDSALGADLEQLIEDRSTLPGSTFEVCLGDLTVERRDEQYRLVRATTLRGGPNLRRSADTRIDGLLAALFPTCPVQDERHRYLELPVSYERPELGNFRLYYELSSDFDPSRKTFFIMNDPQNPGSAADSADVFKQEGWTPADANTIAFDVRGAPCSDIDIVASDGRVDWERAYYAFSMANMIEDIERIRKDALGDEGKLLVAGESGHAFTALQYMAKYPSHVDTAFLVSFGKNLTDSYTAGRQYALDFFSANGLTKTITGLIQSKAVDRGQLLYLIQRLFYSQPQLIVDLVHQLEAGDRSLYDQLSRAQGSPDFEAAIYRHHQPNLVVYFYDLGVRSSGELLDVFYRESQMVPPLEELGRRGIIRSEPATAVDLDKITAVTYIAAGTMDQVVPLAVTEAVFREMVGARFLVFRDAHALMNEEQCNKAIRQSLDRGWDAISQILHSDLCPEFDHSL